MENFKDGMEQVLPGKPMDDIALTDQLMHVLYNIEAKNSDVYTRLAKSAAGCRWKRSGPATVWLRACVAVDYGR